MATPSNAAAYLPKSKAPLLEIKSAPYTHPRKNEILIKNAAVAINLVDNAKRDMGEMLYAWVKYPIVQGFDAAGEVVEVGPGVTRFKAGDRVVGFAGGMEKSINNSALSAFQLYTVLQDHMVSPIPDSLSFESASVIPLALSTAACGLFQKDHLGLRYPTNPPSKPTGETVLITGGATSVGCDAIQLAVAAGYEVISTSSPKNFDYVKKLGATKVFDYNSPTLVKDLIHALQGKTTAGALSIGNGAAEKCMDVMDKCQGNKFVSMASYPNPDPMPTTLVIPKFILHYMTWSVAAWWKSKTKSIGYKFIWGAALKDNEVGPLMFVDFLPAALEDGTFVAAPEPIVVSPFPLNSQSSLAS